MKLLFSVLILLPVALGQDWNDLKVKFGMNPISSSYFIQMPRTVSDTASKGFKKDTECDIAKNKFAGSRYVPASGDHGVMLLFDVQGTIAGIQTRVPKSTGYPSTREKQLQNYWIEEGDSHILTAYFVNPATICSTGRPSSSLQNEGTGTGVYLQKGSPVGNTISFMEIPRNEADIGSTQWSKGKCFVFMGQHYWYNMRMDMECADFMPYFLLYNSGKLDGFGFAMATKMDGHYYEHPTVTVAKQFFPFVPSCMHEAGFPQTFSTVHIYMYSRPWTKLCIF